LLLAAVTILVEPLLSSIILSIYFAGIITIAVLAYKNFSYEIDDTSFEKNYGILQKRTVTIPFEQIQNVNISRSLIEQFLGLASIDIETAGNSGTTKKSVVGALNTTAEGLLPGVTLGQARKLHDLLLQKAAETNQG
ncbi:PH domain-containing protein, partial [Candidatus Saccharibacteria bacterium]|nr:PH domain-containing protein [Candidatus Saccharibacteria bacterium]